MTQLVHYERLGRIAVITVDNPPVNALSQAVRAGILENVRRANTEEGVALIIIICAGRTFIAGADISEFGKPPRDPGLALVLREIMNSAKITVAAIHGAALGGGLETALACHYRCALASAKMGLPEVNLGILPGAGGTQRLPRLAGVDAALEMILSGKPVGAARALELGIIDKLVEGDLQAAAIAYGEELLAQGAKPRRVDDIRMDASALPVNFFADIRQKTARERRGFFAPLKIVDAVEGAVTLPIEEGLRRERELFMECIVTPQSEAQRHAFFAERQVAHIPGITKDTPLRPVRRVGIVGAGTMGGGIAMNFANAGIPVTVVESKPEALARGLQVILQNYRASAEKGRISLAEAERCINLISGSLDYGDLKDADLVIEAVFENMDVKKQVFAGLDDICKPGAILATNTSTLDVDEIAASTRRPQDVIGLHFFSPANVMRLLEIVRGAKTADDVLATAVGMAKTINKIGVVSGVCYGFIGNRMLEGYLREASMMLLEGATPQQVDKALYDFGMAMGPFAMIDMAGVDVSYLVRAERRKTGQLPDDPLYCLVADRLYELGRYGQKTSKGFYFYKPGSRAGEADPEVQNLIHDEAAKHGVAQKSFSDAEIVARCLMPMINEGAKILEEGIALRPGDIDVVWMSGYGFPVYRGGPMFYADTLGPRQVYEKILEFGCDYGPLHWAPATLLARLAAEGKTFAEGAGAK
jgi:3-hydroxyacyl-CoA dehydrogenase